MRKLKLWWKDHFRRDSIKEVMSKYNGLIEVVKVFDKPRLIIGGMIQSGGMVKKIWSKAIKKLKKQQKKIKTVLILGLGCGDCAFEVKKLYPRAEMIGVEIDKHVVNIAKSYFNLASVKNLKVTVNDGVKYVEKLMKQKKKKQFDLIIIDVYLGRKMPKPFRAKKFLKSLRELKAENGTVVFNHLFFGEHRKKAKEFVKDLETVFPEITLQRTASNLLIFSS